MTDLLLINEPLLGGPFISVVDRFLFGLLEDQTSIRIMEHQYRPNCGGVEMHLVLLDGRITAWGLGSGRSFELRAYIASRLIDKTNWDIWQINDHEGAYRLWKALDLEQV